MKYAGKLVILVVVLCVFCKHFAAQTLKRQVTEANKIVISSGQEGGTYYSFGSSLAELLAQRLDGIKVEASKSQGSLQNLNVVKYLNNRFGIVQSDVLYFKEFYRGKIDDYTRAQVVGTIYNEPIYILVKNKLFISKIIDLRGKNVSIGLENSGTIFTTEVLLGMFGIRIEDLKQVPLRYNQLANAFKSEKIDAAFMVIARIPNDIKDLIRNGAVYCLELSKSDLVQIAYAQPNLFRLIDVEDPSRPGKKIRTISVTSVLITNNNTEPNVVAEMTKVLFQLRSRGNYSSIESSINHLLVRRPYMLFGEKGNQTYFHPDSLKYYQTTSAWKYQFLYQAIPYFIPGFVFICSLFFVFLPVFARKWWRNVSDWPKFFRNHVRMWFVLSSYLSIIAVSYIALYSIESGVQNPDIGGNFSGLLKIILHYFGQSKVALITFEGKVVSSLMMIVSGFYGLGVVRSIWNSYLQNKFMELIKMIPKKRSEYIVICNWTDLIEEVITQLRSNAIGEKKRIIIIARSEGKLDDERRACLKKFDNVFLLFLDPACSETYSHTDLDIKYAKTIIIQADENAAEDPDLKSIMIFDAITEVLKRFEQQPDIVVELMKPNPFIEKQISAFDTAKVVSYARLKSRLLAQSAITSKAINFVQEILTATEDSNEVYEIVLPGDVINEIIKRYEEQKTELTFRRYACEIAELYEKNKKNPITVIGIKSNGRLYTNPKDEEFHRICKEEGIEATVVLAWNRPVMPKP